MIYCAPFFLSFLLGMLVISLCHEKEELFTLTDFFAAAGIGIGLTAQIVFYSLLIYGKVFPIGITMLFALAFLVLCGISFFKRKTIFRCQAITWRELMRIGVVLLPVLFYVSLITFQRPYGGWDAWALWGTHASFLFRSGVHWPQAPSLMHHPWLLPLSIVWGWINAGGESAFISIATAIIFTLLTMGLLIAALWEHLKNRFMGYLAGLFLFSIPFFIYHAASQYADILVAYYFLGAVIYFLRNLHAPSSKNTYILSLFLGMLSFVKLEGMVLAGTMFVLFLISSFSQRYKGVSVFRSRFIGCTLILFFPTLFVRFFLPALFFEYGLHPSAIAFSHFGEMKRWLIIKDFLFSEALFNSFWNFFWIIVFVWVILKRKILFQGENKTIFSVLFVFLLITFFLFLLTTYDQAWHLSTALNRMLFEIVPAVIFFLFYMTFKRKTA